MLPAENFFETERSLQSKRISALTDPDLGRLDLPAMRSEDQNECLKRLAVITKRP